MFEEIAVVAWTAKVLRNKWTLKTTKDALLWVLREMVWKFQYWIHQSKTLWKTINFNTIFSGADTGWKNNKAGFIGFSNKWTFIRNIKYDNFPTDKKYFIAPQIINIYQEI